ncbi:hypothetical protein BJX63DRAFT_370058 [Aspergillus granulosus]|uniref:TauD/TfdA-like domain-containing protein n=1 Tax=Aspergillus granulosus TaxID=176169 RepID=A0ABR4H153_9EURO
MEITRCGLGMVEPKFRLPNNFEAIQEDFYSKGIAFIEECNEEILRELAHQLGDVVRPRNEGVDGTGISNIRCTPSLAGKGYSSEELYFHTDRSGWERPPRIVMSTLKKKSTTGGESLLADTTRILKDIKDQGDGLYELLTSSKHSSFASEDGEFVPRPIFDETSSLFRFRFDDNIQLSASLVVRFPQLLDILYRNSFAVALQEGQGYVLDNHRFLHGRTAFTGSRELLRALVNLPPPQSVVTILFDIDGTLCRSEEMSVDAYYSCVSDIVGRSITHANTKVNLHGRTDLGLLHDALDYHKVENKASVIEQFLQRHPSYLQKSLEKGFLSIPCPGVKDTLQWLATKMKNSESPILRIGLMTGNSRPNALLKLTAAGINTSFFDLSISAFGDTHIDRLSLIQESMAKIRARDGSRAFQHNKQKKVIIVGDTPLDIECAKQAGCAVVAVASGNYGMDDLTVLEPDHACVRISESKAYLDSYLAAAPAPAAASVSMVGG